MAINYTPEMVDLMKERYSANPTRETVEELANDSVGIANFAEQLVKTNPKLAESLEFILGVELQEKARREENAD